MIESLDALRATLTGTSLQDCPMAVVPSPDPNDARVALAIDLQGQNRREAWQLLRERVALTGRWPVLSHMLSVCEQEGFAAKVAYDDLFNRFFFEEEPADGRAGDFPLDIEATARRLRTKDLDMRFSHPEATSLDLAEVSYEVERTLARFGVAPDAARVYEALASEACLSERALQWWLLQWELQHAPDPLSEHPYDLQHLEPSEDEFAHPIALLMPSQKGDEVLAWLHFGIALHVNSTWIMAHLRQWREQYGAELYANYGMVIEFQVSRPPATVEEAFEVAWRQYVLANCTITDPRVSVRDHARALMRAKQWQLSDSA